MKFPPVGVRNLFPRNIISVAHDSNPKLVSYATDILTFSVPNADHGNYLTETRCCRAKEAFDLFHVRSSFVVASHLTGRLAAQMGIKETSNWQPNVIILHRFGPQCMCHWRENGISNPCSILCANGSLEIGQIVLRARIRGWKRACRINYESGPGFGSLSYGTITRLVFSHRYH